MNDHTDARGELVFQQACAMGLEGIVSKRLSKPYQSGPSRDWLKVNAVVWYRIVVRGTRRSRCARLTMPRIDLFLDRLGNRVLRLVHLDAFYLDAPRLRHPACTGQCRSEGW
jgi:hypothetical protein